MPPAVAESQTETNSERDRMHNWHMVRHFQTLEDAQAALRELTNDGVTASMSMIDGLSVIASRV